MSSDRRTILIALVTLVVAVVLASPSASFAKDGMAVKKAGACSKGSSWKLKLSEEDGKIETEFEVDQNRRGVTWKVVLRLRGAIVFKGTRMTRAPSGSFTVRRLLADRPGSDRVSARAMSPSGEICRAVASYT